MAREIAESTNNLSVFFLNKYGYLPQGQSFSSGGIKWTRYNWENSIRFFISTSSHKNETRETSYIELIYTVTVNWSGEKADMKYKIPLITTPCNYGGRRYWFRCNLKKNGVYCGRRVGVIYSVDKWFGCRYCADVAYQAQFEGGFLRSSLSEPDVEKAYKEIGRFYYKGKPTRKYKRYLRLSRKMDDLWIKAGIKFGAKL